MVANLCHVVFLPGEAPSGARRHDKLVICQLFASSPGGAKRWKNEHQGAKQHMFGKAQHILRLVFKPSIFLLLYGRKQKHDKSWLACFCFFLLSLRHTKKLKYQFFMWRGEKTKIRQTLCFQFIAFLSRNTKTWNLQFLSSCWSYDMKTIWSILPINSRTGLWSTSFFLVIIQNWHICG